MPKEPKAWIVRDTAEALFGREMQQMRHFQRELYTALLEAKEAHYKAVLAKPLARNTPDDPSVMAHACDAVHVTKRRMDMLEWCWLRLGCDPALFGDLHKRALAFSDI